MKYAWFVLLRVMGKEGARDGRAVGSRRGKTTERTQEVAVAQQDTILGSENEPKGHGAWKKKLLWLNNIHHIWLWKTKPKAKLEFWGESREPRVVPAIRQR